MHASTWTSWTSSLLLRNRYCSCVSGSCMNIWWPWHRLSRILLQNTLIDACVLDSDSGLLQQVRYCQSQLPQDLRTLKGPMLLLLLLKQCHRLPRQPWYCEVLVAMYPVHVCFFAGLRYNWGIVPQDTPESCPGTVPPGNVAFTFLCLCFPPAKTGLCVDSVLWTVGVPPRLGAALQADAATADARWLQSGVLLPPEPYWSWLRVLSVPVK